jgi:hypothetical membrane protein
MALDPIPPTPASLRLGLVIPVLFWATTFVCAGIQGGYNPLTRIVSDLGALGTPSQHVFTAGLVLCSLLSMVFVAALARACGTLGLSALPALLILTFTVSIGGAGLFPLPLRLHLLLGLPSVLLPLSPLLALVQWRGRLPWGTALALPSVVLMSMGFLAFLPLLPEYPGLKQRLFHAGWSLWFGALSLAFTRALATRPPSPPRSPCG